MGTAVVCGVGLCQHLTPNFSHCRYDKNGSLRARENVFDPHFCPPCIKEGAEQAYMYKIEKAARIIFGCPCLVVDEIFVPNSYIDFMFLHVYLLQ
jgi:hypothetical protein